MKKLLWILAGLLLVLVLFFNSCDNPLKSLGVSAKAERVENTIASHLDSENYSDREFVYAFFWLGVVPGVVVVIAVLGAIGILLERRK